MLTKLLFLFLVVSGFLVAQLKTVSYWTSPTMSIERAEKLSRFSMVIADLDNAWNNLNSLLKIKELNPNLKLICYSNPMEIFDPLVKNRPRQNAWSTEIINSYPNWLLKTLSGKKAVFFEGMRMLNLSADCPRINGQTYGEWMAKLLIKDVLSLKDEQGNLIWDGYFMDNCSPTISWVSPRDPLDVGKSSPELIDRSWSEGNYKFLSIIRQAMGRDFILIGNKGVTDYRDLLDGRMFEWFPNDYLGAELDGGWWQSMANAAQTGPYTIFLLQSKYIDFGILSASLLDNVYVGVGNNSLRYYEQFNYNFDRPGKIKIIREFGKKVVIVSPSDKEAEIEEEE